MLDVEVRQLPAVHVLEAGRHLAQQPPQLGLGEVSGLGAVSLDQGLEAAPVTELVLNKHRARLHPAVVIPKNIYTLYKYILSVGTP